MTDAEKLQEEYDRRRGERLQLEAFVSLSGWRLIRSALDATRLNWQKQLETAPSTMDGAFLSATAKGVIMALRLASSFPDALIENCQEDETKLQEAITQAITDAEKPNG